MPDWRVNGGMRPGRKTTERKCSSRRSRARVCSTSLGTHLPVRNQSGIRVDRRVPTGLQVYRNNLIYANAIGLEVDFGGENNNPTWENNLVFGNDADYSGIANQTGLSGNISADPQLVDP